MNANSKRIYYLDRIKILLCLLVIGLHTTIAYGGSGSWFYVEEVHNTLINVTFTIYDTVCQSFFMGLFFFISAYFTVPSYNKKGCRKFLKDRFIRLFIPLCIFYFVLHPTTDYFIEKMSLGKPISYFQYMYNSIVYLDNLGFGPLWFVEALIIFSIGYVLYRKIIRGKTDNLQKNENGKSQVIEIIDFPGKKSIFTFMVILGVITFIVRLVCPAGEELLGMKLGYFPQYIALFALGTIAYENHWLYKLTDKISSFYFKVAIFCFFLLIVILMLSMILSDGNLNAFMGGISIQALIYALWEPFMCVGISLKLISIFKKKNYKSSDLWTNLSLDTYPVYVIHAPVNVFLECMLITAPLNPIIKFILVFIATCVICFAVSHFILRKLPVLRKIF